MMAFVEVLGAGSLKLLRSRWVVSLNRDARCNPCQCSWQLCGYFDIYLFMTTQRKLSAVLRQA